MPHPPRADHADPTRPTAGQFLLTATQLGLLLFAIRALELERSLGLVAITPVIFLGYGVHAWLPARWKPAGFLALSLAGFFVVLGPGAGALVTAISLGLFGLCHLPAGLPLRVALLVGAGALLTAVRADWIETSWSEAVVPVVGSMFMFRAIVYLYDLRHEREAAPWCTRLSYFFLLPNVCFLLFPVVDYRTFRRTWNDVEPHRIHQRGIALVLRGVVHLVAYRGVYLYLTPTLVEVDGLFGVVRFVVSSYLLYLRISGHFHLIVGLLHLFGFHLPDTNHNYLFASSFTDTWRRINVYWTEFMKKIVYFPVFMGLRGRGTLAGVVGATSATFVATWWLHAYQWFWLNGEFPLWSDGLFWGLAGMLALGTMLWETRAGATARVRSEVPTWGGALRHGLQVLGTLSVICLIWSIWCSPSFGAWLAILAEARDAQPGEWRALSLAVLVVLAAGTVGQRLRSIRWPPVSPAVLRTAGSTAVAVLALAPLQRALGPSVGQVLASLSTDELNTRDRERRMASYYDRLIDREGFGGRVRELQQLDPDDFDTFMDTALVRRIDSDVIYELARSVEMEFLGAHLTTNRWGMRDTDYELSKGPDTFRIAVLGTCYELGAGVDDEHVWDRLVEERLAREVTPRTGVRYEVLNFSVPGYAPYQQLHQVRDRLAEFEPDVVLLSNHLGSSVKHLIRIARMDHWPQELRSMLPGVEPPPGADPFALRALFTPHQERLENALLDEIASAVRDLGAVPVLLEVPFVEPPIVHPEAFERRIAGVRAVARSAGYEVLDIGSAFEGLTYEEAAVTRFQHCPSVLGQARLADAFFDALLAAPRLYGRR